VIIVDAGGGTIDLSAYGRKPEVRNSLYHEIAAAECRSFLWTDCCLKLTFRNAMQATFTALSS
jgi:hypothetical protein